MTPYRKKTFPMGLLQSPRQYSGVKMSKSLPYHVARSTLSCGEVYPIVWQTKLDKANFKHEFARILSLLIFYYYYYYYCVSA